MESGPVFECPHSLKIIFLTLKYTVLQSRPMDEQIWNGMESLRMDSRSRLSENSPQQVSSFLCHVFNFTWQSE